MIEIQQPRILLELESKIAGSPDSEKTAVFVGFLKFIIIDKDFEKWCRLANSHTISVFFSRLSRVLDQILVNEDKITLLIPYTSLLYYIRFLSGEMRGIDHQLLPFFSPEGAKNIAQSLQDQKSGGFQIFLNYVTTRLHGLSEVSEAQSRVLQEFARTSFEGKAELPYVNLHLLWALSSYGDGSLNQQIKNRLNKLLTDSIEKNGLSTVPKIKYLPFTRSEKPRVLVVCEEMHPLHVMHRCFSRPLAELKKYFYVIALTAEDDKGEKPWLWCDELVTFDIKNFAINILLERVQKILPDVIVYPSIGLKMWGLILSRIRLAPLQISLMGHPDFPFSHEIDHVVIGRILGEKMKNPKMITLDRSPGSLFNFAHEGQYPEARFRENTPIIRIAVCANVFKLTSPFLQTCKQIKKDSPKPVQFIILQNLKGYHYLLGRKQAEWVLGADSVQVFPALKTKKYRETLSSCDLYLSPFPFGGENSTLDALLSGLPVISLIGNEPRQRLDYRVLNTAGLHQYMSFSTIERYHDQTIELIGNDTKRKALFDLVNPEVIRKKFELETQSCQNELSDTIVRLFEQRAKSSPDH